MTNATEIKKLQERMAYLGEEVWFTDEERSRLNSVFTAGTICSRKSGEVVMPLFAYYIDENEKTRCCHEYEFGRASLECMYQICKDRIETTEKVLDEFFNNFNLQKVAEFLNKQFKEFSNYADVRSPEWAKRAKIAKNSKAEVENGKCGYDKHDFDCVVVRSRGCYGGLLKISQTKNGYKITRRVPLCGECTYECEKYEIFKELKEIAMFMCS